MEQEILLRYIEQSKQKLILAVGKEEVLKAGKGKKIRKEYRRNIRIEKK